MAKAGDELVNSVAGLRTAFRNTIQDTSGELLQVNYSMYCREGMYSEVWSGGIPTAATVTVSREDLHPARNNIHLLVDAFPPGPQYHPSQPYIQEDDENVA